MNKENKNVVIVAFWLLIVFAIYSIFAISKMYLYKLNVQGFNFSLKPVVVNLEFDKKILNQKIFFCFNDYCKTPLVDDHNNVYYYSFDSEEPNFFNTKVKNISILYPKESKNLKDNIKTIALYSGVDDYYYSKKDISAFKNSEISISINNSDDVEKYNAVLLPEINNYKGYIHNINVLFLSLFYNWKIFIVPYFWLFIAFILYVFNADKFNFKITNKAIYIILGMVVLIGAAVRLVDINYFPLWLDEIYTKTIAIQNFKSCFSDAGNPPLFFCFEYIFTKIFSNSVFSLRFLPFLFGVLFPVSVFALFKDINKKEALFLAFLASVNLISIYYSQEARGYTLTILMSIIVIYTLFKYLNNPTKKNLIIYSVVLAMSINCNYYLGLFAFTNFIWGIVDLIQNKNKNHILKFSLANFIAALTFLPYYFISTSQAVSTTFNELIPSLDSNTFLYIINFYFSNKTVFLILAVVVLINLILCYTNFKFVCEKKKNLLIYLVYSIVLILILASGISILIKPILHKKVLLGIYGLLFLTEALCIVSVVQLNKFNKFLVAIKGLYIVILTFAYFSIIQITPMKQVYNIDNYMKFIANDSKLYKDNYKIYAFVNSIADIKNYPEVSNLDYINWKVADSNSGEIIKNIDKKDYTKYKNEKSILYMNPIGVDYNNLYFTILQVRAYRSNLTNSAKVIIE